MILGDFGVNTPEANYYTLIAGDHAASCEAAAAAFKTANSALSWAEPRCSIERDPRRDDHTICTAVAPELVLTVRRYATTAP
jgi:hypothetical protein